mgnify:CR=1 FL=1
MATVSHKLKSAFDGALAGGGDPASSPLYVFGPFLQMVVASGVAYVTFGASIWLAILTVFTVSAVYRLVMKWIIDGSGGSGLCEEEFGPWAVKINASVTIIEYTLTFLVSIAALVTFVSDRFHQYMNVENFIFPIRTDMAIIVSILVGLGVNLGPKISTRIFGPATLGVIILLWIMIVASVWQFGLHFPSLHLSAFNWDNIHYTLGGYARILALMTGIEIFANLVPAYQGPAHIRSKRAFGSLLIIMGTTSLTMLIVGPVILQLADPMNETVSVFTQTMDKLLPVSLAYFGTTVAVIVLLSAAAASAQGIQNLALGLRYRHYIPAKLGAVNRFEVANKPVWMVIAICIVCYIFIGTHEETYLALYAAGVFILLSLTSWAAVKRLLQQMKERHPPRIKLAVAGSITAAILTSLATVIIFEERFVDGAWFYVVLTPIMYVVFTYFRNKLGKPKLISERIGTAIAMNNLSQFNQLSYDQAGVVFKQILVPLDQSPSSEYSLSCAQTLARSFGGTIHLLSVLSEKNEITDNGTSSCLSATDFALTREYLEDIKADLVDADYPVVTMVKEGDPASVIGEIARQDMDIIIMIMHHDQSLLEKWLKESVTLAVIRQTTPALIALRPTNKWRSTRTRFKHILVALDASATAELVLPYVKALAATFMSQVTLLSVPEVSDSDEVVTNIKRYVKKIAGEFQHVGIEVNTLVSGTDPSQAIIQTSQELNCDLVMMVTHGRGGTDRQNHIKLGSVTEAVLRKSECPLFLVSGIKKEE